MKELIEVVRELLHHSAILPNRKGELHDVLTEIGKGAADVAEVAGAAAELAPESEPSAAAPESDGPAKA